jgi:hypothetical protein
MRKTFFAAAFALLAISVSARAKTILPDACGDDSVKFDVSLKKDQPPPGPPEAGKAQVVLVQSAGIVIRFGLDGAWAGANKGDSYFAVAVTPGPHTLCTAVQPGMGASRYVKDSVQLLPFTAEAGKTYYFEAVIGLVGVGGRVPPTSGANGATGGGPVTGGGSGFFGLNQLTDDVGKYRVKAWKLSVSKPNK